MDVKGVKVAQLSYTYGTNGVSAPGGRSGPSAELCR